MTRTVQKLKMVKGPENLNLGTGALKSSHRVGSGTCRVFLERPLLVTAPALDITFSSCILVLSYTLSYYPRAQSK